jgi:ABC-2 type transport system ATP-binding protein
VRGLRKAYGERVALAGVSLDVLPGEIVGIIGRNGSGKTTLVECILGLRRADDGRVRVLGLDPQADRGRLRALVGCQLQESALPDRLRAGEALELFASLAAEPADPRALLAEWGLTGHRRTPFAALSGGQRQRLLVALALVTRPRVVFLDEMTTGLDPSARRTAWGLIDDIRRRGTTVVLVTHFMDEAERLCDRLVVLREGRVVGRGSPGELIARHAGQTRVTFTAAADVGFLRAVPGVRAVERTGGRVIVRGEGPLCALVGAALVARGLAPTDLRPVLPGLEDVFLALTGEEGA